MVEYPVIESIHAATKREGVRRSTRVVMSAETADGNGEIKLPPRFDIRPGPLGKSPGAGVRRLILRAVPRQ